MNVTVLDRHDLDEVMKLFNVCFADDPYYAGMCGGTRLSDSSIRESISWCLDNGFCLGIREASRLIAFLLCFDYSAVKKTDPADLRLIFAGSRDAEALPYADTLHAPIGQLNGTVMYCLSVASDPQYRCRGLASGMIDLLLDRYPDCYIVSDVSNEGSLPIYRKRGFEITALDQGYFLIVREPGKAAAALDFGAPVKVMVPDTSVLEQNAITYTLLKEKRFLPGCRLDRSEYGSAFIFDPQSVAESALISLDYAELLKYQRYINLSHFTEKLRGDCLYYEQHVPYDGQLLMNRFLQEMLPSRKREWAIVPDVFVSVPVEYGDETVSKCTQEVTDEKSAELFRDLDFRTHYEAGIPRSAENIDDLSSFKRRIRRYYLGKIRIRISGEVTVEHYDSLGDPIGAAALVDLYLTVDTESKCGVLTWYSLSAPFLISHLMDNVIRNQLQVIENGDPVNFYAYLNQNYGLTKRGTSKIYSVIPADKDCLSSGQLASLVAAETIYPDGENLGGIVDPEIVGIVSSDTGMGQYDRAAVYAYTNTVLQFSPDFQTTVSERLYEESIVLFYMELILIEEAAIRIANRATVALLSSTSLSRPVDFLKSVDTVFDDYSKTIDFWDIQVNYPTSQKSIDMLRSAFRIDSQLEYLHRNQTQLQTVFETKSDIIDRQDSKRMDTSLAILSLFAVISAWLDSHDFIATFSDVLSEKAISVIQTVAFFVILFAAGYVVTHLFGSKIRAFLRNLRSRFGKGKK